MGSCGMIIEVKFSVVSYLIIPAEIILNHINMINLEKF